MRKHNWHDSVFFGIHYDLHANAHDTNLGAEVTHDHLRERLLRVRPDWIQVDCKGHPGYTSWPTKVGSTSPGVVRDSLRITRDVTAELGIKLGMHYSGVIDNRAIELHPEWARLDVHGNADTQSTCRMSGYTDELLIPQMLELIDNYDVDGFWVDGENWGSKPCWCERCRAEFTRRTGIIQIPQDKVDAHWESWLAFHRDLFVEHVTRYTNAVHARKPTCLICSNWMYTVRQPDAITAPVDYLSGDYTWAWGAERAAIEARLLDSRSDRISWDLMAWGFTKAGPMRVNPPWTLKTALHLCQEVAEVVALGGAIMIYGKPQRSGWLTAWHQDVLGEVADFCRVRKEVCFQSETVPQAAVLHLASSLYAWSATHADTSKDPALFTYNTAVAPVEGALHALLENHRPTDLLTEEAALERLQAYRLVVVPEQIRLSEEIVNALTRYAENGGHVILSGAHLSQEYASLVGCVPASESLAESPNDSWGAIHLPIGERTTGLFGPWQPITPQADTSVLFYALCGQEVEKDQTDQAVITQRRLGKGSIIAIHGPIFRNYAEGHYPELRRFLGVLIDNLALEWLVTVEAPRKLEVILRRKAGKLMLNLLNRGAGEMLSPTRVVVEELPPVTDVTLRLHSPVAPRSVTLVPDEVPLTWQHHGDTLEIHVPQVPIHNIVVIEPA